MTDAEIVENLLANGLSDDKREIADEMVDAMQSAFSRGSVPDENTVLAAGAIFTIARTTLEGMYGMGLAEIANEDGEKIDFEDGAIPEQLAESLRAGALMMAIARDEDKHRPMDMAVGLIKSVFSRDDKMHYAKMALDNIRKGKHFTDVNAE